MPMAMLSWWYITISMYGTWLTVRADYIWSKQMSNVNDFSLAPQILIENKQGYTKTAPALMAKLDLGSLH